MNFNIHLASWLRGKDDVGLLVDFKGNDPKQVISQDPIKVRFDYPLSEEVVFDCPGPVTVWGFVTFVAKTYEQIYREENETTSVQPTQGAGAAALLNRNQTNGKYGVWGHVLGDLYLEGARLDKDGVWDLEVGS